jgi:Transposase DDE domain
MASISQTFLHIKHKVRDWVTDGLILACCREVGYTWRERDLGPVCTTYLFLQQILHGNTACTHLRLLSGLSVSASAYCQARTRLPLQVLERLQQAVTGSLRRRTEAEGSERWHGHRTYFLDGSGFSMPDTAQLQAHFGQPSGQAKGCGFPVAHLMVLFDAATGFLLQTSALPLRTSDLAQAPAMHTVLSPGDLLVGDRAFGSYGHLALCGQREIKGLFRAHQKQIIDFHPGRPHRPRDAAHHGPTGLPSSRWIKRLGPNDQLVEYFKPKECPNWMSLEAYAQLPDSMVVRELRVAIRRYGFRTRAVTLVTTLLDAERYSARELAELFLHRWELETNLRHLKQTMKLDVLRCHTVPGVLKELTMFVLVYNLVRRVMLAAARRQAVALGRISFIDALRWLQEVRPGEDLRDLIVNPHRPGRGEPRVRKRRPKQFPVMKKPRADLRKALFGERHAA